MDNPETQAPTLDTKLIAMTNQRKNTTQKTKTLSNTNLIKKRGDEPRCSNLIKKPGDETK
jgi:hypothetical protein